jgi:arsenite methyltransferase
MNWLKRLRVFLKTTAFTGPGRDNWQKPDQVVTALGLRPGQTVADLGSGGGYFTFRFGTAVAPDGTVFAVDTDGELLEAIRDRALKTGRSEVQTVAARDGKLDLPSPVDLIFLSNVFHHLPEQAAYFDKARGQLAAGGRVAIIEGRSVGLFAKLFGHTSDPDRVLEVMERAGYERVANHDFLRRQSFQVFAPVTATGGPLEARSSAVAAPAPYPRPEAS